MNIIKYFTFNWQNTHKGSWKRSFSSSLYFDIKKGLNRFWHCVKSILQSIWHFLFGGMTWYYKKNFIRLHIDGDFNFYLNEKK
jgi:predicted cupin superfamily sugar epimerase